MKADFREEKNIIGLMVYTQGGIFLGRVVDFEIEPNSGQIVKYFVKSKNPIKNLFQRKLVISKEQVISIDKEKMIVEDNWQKIKEPKLKPVIT
ncbi:MAG: PRC-barrel domain-containing protein [Patescibacteria group bacterium]